jgi:hypothetical protein
MEISAETLDRIADRFTDLAAHTLALQAILLEKGLMTEQHYGQVLDEWRAIVANQPSERAWKEALQARRDGGKR